MQWSIISCDGLRAIEDRVQVYFEYFVYDVEYRVQVYLEYFAYNIEYSRVHYEARPKNETSFNKQNLLNLEARAVGCSLFY